MDRSAPRAMASADADQSPISCQLYALLEDKDWKRANRHPPSESAKRLRPDRS
jgi:hypothetical protein